MGPANGSVLPEIPSAIAACLKKTGGGKQVVIAIQKLGKYSITQYLQEAEDYYNKRRIKIPPNLFIFIKHG